MQIHCNWISTLQKGIQFKTDHYFFWSMGEALLPERGTIPWKNSFVPKWRTKVMLWLRLATG